MTEIITRLYGAAGPADAAVAALKDYGFFSSGIFVVRPPGTPDVAGADRTAALDGLADEIMKGWVLRYQAKIYAEEVLAGGTLVTVHAYFGFAKAATMILDEAGPIPSRVSEPARAYIGYDTAAPLSSALLLPVLADSHASFSRFFSMPILGRPDFSLSRVLGLPETAPAAPMKTSFGLPLLMDSPPILSSLFRLPTLL